MLNIGLSKDETRKIADKLNILLSDEYLFLTKLLKYHWNIVGPFFGPLHKLFDDQYKEVFEIIDAVAERTRSLGQLTFGTLDEFKRNGSIRENAQDFPPAEKMVADLVEDHETIIRQIRTILPEIAELRDEGSVNFLGDLIERHEKMAWFLRAHIER